MNWFGRTLFRVRRRVYPVDVLVRAFQDYSKDHGATFAAAMSYYVLLSLFPTMIFLVSVVGLVARDPAYQLQLVDMISDLFPSGLGIRDQIETVVTDVSDVSSIVGLLGLLGTLWTASNMFGALRRALNLAFDVPELRSFFIGRLMDMFSIVAVMLMMLLSVAATAAVRLTEDGVEELVGDNSLLTFTWNVVYFFLPFLLSLFVFIMIYRLIPNFQVGLREVLIGASIAALGFELAKWGFTIYISNFANYQEVYGALGGVIAFMVFVFIVSNIIIFAAEIASELSKDRAREIGGGIYSFYH